ncbi:protoheme IX farnesyltransferase, mitochondrial-like [Octopus sinensis]|uniref:Heme O synthase n=1 Tax=Octopus sinensis TaxID=2607531 RepID=A0A7E6EKN1_9MOLL|nr:protoheme IX farnesyltransferase, mitochondrial-like [Octopus sinensis]
MVGYLVACDAINLSTLALTSLGTFLTSSSAASLNQLLEIPFDSQMNRTKDRVLVQSNISPEGTLAFALATGISGIVILSTLVSSATAMLAFGNLILYSFIYTPMKRYSVANTFVGSFVGAIPPIIGWHAATGSFDSGLDFWGDFRLLCAWGNFILLATSSF